MISIFGLFENLIELNVTALRIIRVTRIFRVFKSLHELNEILMNIYESVSYILAMCMMSFLMMFVFSIMGMRMFYDIDLEECDELDNNRNFTNFYTTITTMWTMATLDGWNAIMHDTLKHKGMWVSIYWIIFVYINAQIFMNIAVAVIFEKMESKSKLEFLDREEKVFFEIYREAMESFV